MGVTILATPSPTIQTFSSLSHISIARDRFPQRTMNSGNEAGESSGINAEKVAPGFVEAVRRRFKDNPDKLRYFIGVTKVFKETGDFHSFRGMMEEILWGHADLLVDFYCNFKPRKVPPKEQQPAKKEKQD